jgi:PKD repeat protein
MFATAAESGGTIYEKTSPIDAISFPTGQGTPFIRDAASANMNNATSTKQSVNSRTGLVVLASNNSTKVYWHADLPIAAAQVPAPGAGFTASPTSGVAPLNVSFTDTSTGSPTAWNWDFGNGATSTAQNPTTTYTAAGTYTVTLTASNAGGSSTATRTINVSAPTSPGIVRQTESTKVDTTADTHLTIPKPAGTSSGDLLVSCFGLNGSTVRTAPSGWTAITAVTSVTRPRVYGYYRIAGASEPVSYRWITNASVASSGGIVRYSGASGLDAPAAKASGLSGTTATVPGVTTVTSNAMVVGCMGVGLSATPVQITGPVDMSQVWDLAGTQNEFDDVRQATPGPTGTRTWTFTHARDWAGWVAALRPR